MKQTLGSKQLTKTNNNSTTGGIMAAKEKSKKETVKKEPKVEIKTVAGVKVIAMKKVYKLDMPVSIFMLRNTLPLWVNTRLCLLDIIKKLGIHFKTYGTLVSAKIEDMKSFEALVSKAKDVKLPEKKTKTPKKKAEAKTKVPAKKESVEGTQSSKVKTTLKTMKKATGKSVPEGSSEDSDKSKTNVHVVEQFLQIKESNMTKMVDRVKVLQIASQSDFEDLVEIAKSPEAYADLLRDVNELAKEYGLKQ